MTTRKQATVEELRKLWAFLFPVDVAVPDEAYDVAFAARH